MIRRAPIERDTDTAVSTMMPEAQKTDDVDVRQSIQIQAQIGEIGAKMGFRIWVPPSDRVRVLSVVQPAYKGAFFRGATAKL